MNYRLFSILTLVAVTCSCIGKQQKDVEAYLNDKYGSVGSIEVTEISQIDSLYSPFEDLASMTLAYSGFNLTMSKALAAADDLVYQQPYYPGKMKDFMKILGDALRETDDSLHREVLPRIMYSMDHPEKPSLDKNRIGVKAAFSVGDLQNTAYFFYNHDGQTIGHSSLENMTAFKNLLDIKGKYSRLRSEIDSEVK